MVTHGKCQDLLLKHTHQRIFKQITHVQLISLLNHLLLLFLHQPADVGEEETPRRIVWVGVGVAELVMHPMITNPVIQRVLKKSRYNVIGGQNFFGTLYGSSQIHKRTSKDTTRYFNYPWKRYIFVFLYALFRVTGICTKVDNDFTLWRRRFINPQLILIDLDVWGE